MSLQDVLNNRWVMQPQPNPEEPDKDEEEKEERAEVDTRMLYKRLESYFYQSRSIYLWGIVDDKSAKDVVTKLLLLDADKPGEEIKFLSAALVDL
jgi:ATP-dependent Clp protease protease subunit